MKFNPYPVLLTTGVLMFATVVFTQVRSTVALVIDGSTDASAKVATPDEEDATLAVAKNEPLREAGGPPPRR
jgi:hypothetical protein